MGPSVFAIMTLYLREPTGAQTTSTDVDVNLRTSNSPAGTPANEREREKVG